MPITRAKKENIVAELKDKIVKAEALVFTKAHGLSVATVSEFRRRIRKEKGNYVVVKKTLLELALRETGKEVPPFPGEVSFVAGYENGLGAFRSAVEFAKKEKESFEILGGYFEGKFVDGATARALGLIPSREALVGQLMGVLQGTIRKFMYVVGQIAKQKS